MPIPLMSQQRPAQRDGDPSAGPAQRPPHRLAQALGRRFQFVAAGHLQQHHEFLAAEPVHLVVLAHLEPQDRGQIGDGVVAGGVAVEVVDLLEAVQVQHDQPVASPAQRLLLDRQGQGAFHHPAVGNVGQRVQRGQFLQFDPVVLAAGGEGVREQRGQRRGHQGGDRMEHVGEHPRQHAQGHQHGQAGGQRQAPVGEEEVGQQHQVQPGQGDRADQPDRQQAAAGIQQAHQIAAAHAVAAAAGVDHHAQDGDRDQRVHRHRGEIAAHQPVNRERGDHHSRGHAQQGDQFQADVAVLGVHPGNVRRPMAPAAMISSCFPMQV